MDHSDGGGQEGHQQPLQQQQQQQGQHPYNASSPASSSAQQARGTAAGQRRGQPQQPQLAQQPYPPVQYQQQGQPLYDPVTQQQIGGGGFPIAAASQQIYQQQQVGQQIPYAPVGYPAVVGAGGGAQRVPNMVASAVGASASNVAIAAAAALDPYQLQQSLHLHQQQQAQALAAAAAVAPAPALAVGSGLTYGSTASASSAGAAAAVAAAASSSSSLVRPRVGRLPATRPVVKLSVGLIDTYKHINTVYYEERDARRAARAKEKMSTTATAAASSTTAATSGASGGGGPGGAQNDGWDDENYDYIVTPGEIFYGRYRMMERIGKGSFGQVVRAEDIETRCEVAIKIIKSKKPFLLQAKTEIELLTTLFEKDPKDQHNLVRLLTHFMYRNHQCIVFEMLSLNLYELLKNTQFGGVSLNLIRKFAKQVLRALAFLARPDVDIIHCDLKPENILLRHPKKSAIKVIDFGSSCRSNKRMYSYIQSRFYRSPEVMLGLPYSVAIDMWSLGCILVEMHTGEPLFSGTDQFDQMQKIVKILGMIPDGMLEKASDQIKFQFFMRGVAPSGSPQWYLRQTKPSKSDVASSATTADLADPTAGAAEGKEKILPSPDPMASLAGIITAGSRNKKKNYPPSEAYNSARNYELFVDLVFKMLAYHPEDRISPKDALQHPFITTGDPAANAAALAAAQALSEAEALRGPAAAAREASAPTHPGSSTSAPAPP